MKLTIESDLILIGVGVALVAAWYLKKGASSVIDAAGTAAQAVNPANPNNVINQGATSVYQAATGSNDTIGGSLYNFFHGDAGAVATAPTSTAPKSGQVTIDQPTGIDFATFNM